MGRLRLRLPWRLTSIAMVVGIVYMVLGCGYQDNVVWVYGLDSHSEQPFSYPIKNNALFRDGLIYEFKIGVPKAEFFAQLKRRYAVFGETPDRLQLIDQGEIYAIRQFTDGHYALSGEWFQVRGSSGELLRFPFPTDRMSPDSAALRQGIPFLNGLEFKADCDLAYLLRFYRVYGDKVKVDGNRITYDGVSITVGESGLIEVATP